MKKLETKFTTIRKYYMEHYTELRTYVIGKVRNPEVADDIVQNVFTRLLSLAGIITVETLSNLVYTIVRNLICDHYRHKKFENEYAGYVCSLPCSVQWNVMPECDVAEIKEILECGMARLNEKQRMIYRMNVYDGLAVSEISKTLNMNYKSVENRLGSARKEMRKYITRMLA